jgi:hypothetical protein
LRAAILAFSHNRKKGAFGSGAVLEDHARWGISTISWTTELTAVDGGMALLFAEDVVNVHLDVVR